MKDNPAVMSVPRIVIGIVQNNDGHFLLIERAAAEGPLRFAFPGGKVEAGETDAAAVLREIAEETGLACTITRRIGARVHPQSGREIAYYLCQAPAGAAPAAAVREAKSAAFYTGADARRLITSDIFAPVARLLDGGAPQPQTKGPTP
jgi:8-oxo-dGTP diphosphatase